MKFHGVCCAHTVNTLAIFSFFVLGFFSQSVLAWGGSDASDDPWTWHPEDEACPVETCREGVCVPWLSVYDPCLFGRVNCGAPYELECANLGKDESNCGSCGVKCAHGSTCVSGVCKSPTATPEETDVR